MKDRILELDLLRGVGILLMIPIHFLFDLKFFLGISIQQPYWLNVAGSQGHLLFILLSGICATLGNSPFRRGIIVLIAGLAVSYVTLFLDLILGFDNLRIWFGILHLLGICMLLYPCFQNLSAQSLWMFSFLFIASGIVFQKIQTEIPWLFPLGLCAPGVFPGSDYFPVFPYSGWFLAGAATGKQLYRNKISYFPGISRKNKVIRFLAWTGRNSLIIYLIHQPVLFLLIYLWK